MKIRILIIYLVLIGAMSGCKKPLINYPYAENNTTTISYLGVDISDDYLWLESDPADNKVKAQWLDAQNDLCEKYFGNKGLHIFNQLSHLAGFPRYRFLRSSTDTLYYAGIYPCSDKFEVYKQAEGNSVLIKTFHFAYDYESDVNALVFEDGKHMAVMGKSDDSDMKNIYIYSLINNSSEPIAVIKNVLAYPLLPGKANSFFFVRDVFAPEGSALGVNTIFHCNYNSQSDSLSVSESEFYADSKGRSDYIFDMAYDEQNDRFFIGEYSLKDPAKFIVYEAKEGSDKILYEFQSPIAQQFRLAGADEVNVYVIGIDASIKGQLYALNQRTLNVDTVISEPTLNIRFFSLIKNGALAYFQNDKQNKAYHIDKHTLKAKEIPVDDKKYYTFAHNKKSDRINFQQESLISPKSIYELDSLSQTGSVRISEQPDLPFNPDDYEIEYLTIRSTSGDDVHLQFSYKKGMVRDGQNPMIISTFVNDEKAFSENFNLIRILYMDHGFIYVQRACSDTKTNLKLAKRPEDIYSVYRYMIDNGYSSPDKMAIMGREFGASALLHALNKYPIEAPCILVDGIYDYAKYNAEGKVLFQYQKVFHVTDTLEFKHVMDVSPYHNVVSGKNYPPILLVTTKKNSRVSANDTYRLAARLQMRTKASNPVILLSPPRKEMKDDDYNFKKIVEYGFVFIANQHGIDFKIPPWE